MPSSPLRPATASLHDAAWIWTAGAGSAPHQYRCFRTRFHLASRPRQAELELAVDSDFICWVNGQEAGRGQFSDWPQTRTFTSLPVGPMLQRGVNVIAVLAYFRGEDFSDHAAGHPGLLAALCGVPRPVLTGPGWRACPHPAFRPGPMPRVTVQMGFTTEFDARRDLPWQEPDFDDSGWPEAEILSGATTGYWREVRPRPVPMLVPSAPLNTMVVAQGTFHRQAEQETVARTMLADALCARRIWEVFEEPALPAEYTMHPPRPGFSAHGSTDPLVTLPPQDADGVYLIVDLGREETGLLTLEIEAPTGTVLDIAHGEHLADGRVRAAIHGRNFADRYLCREGRQTYTLPFRRLGARYLEIHASGFTRQLKWHYAGLRPLDYPVQSPGPLNAANYLAETLQQVGLRTLQLCMHEHYEDCPWREQSLYAFDGRLQALYGYYGYGNYDFAAASFSLLGEGLGEDALLPLTAPGRVPVNIPMFTLAWISALGEHFLFSGSSELFTRFRATIEKILTPVLDRYDSTTGLYRHPEGQGMWHYYDWSDGFAGTMDKDPQASDRLDAPYNLHLLDTLRWYEFLLAASGEVTPAARWSRARRSLAHALQKCFWNPEKELYASYLVQGQRHHYGALMQSLAVYEGLPPARDARRLSQRLSSGDLGPLTPGTWFFHLAGAMRLNAATRSMAATAYTEQWTHMLRQGATSYWETLQGATDFADAGSLCHGWSALPVYFTGACLLGITPLEPGFMTFQLQPFAFQTHACQGSVPTPHGPLEVCYEHTGQGLAVTVRGPRQCNPVPKSYSEYPLREVIYNGRKFNF